MNQERLNLCSDSDLTKPMAMPTASSYPIVDSGPYLEFLMCLILSNRHGTYQQKFFPFLTHFFSSLGLYGIIKYKHIWMVSKRRKWKRRGTYLQKYYNNYLFFKYNRNSMKVFMIFFEWNKTKLMLRVVNLIIRHFTLIISSR